MMNCWPSCCESFAAIGRANVSVPPPAGNGLRKVTGLVGQACAFASAATAVIESAAVRRRNTFEGVFMGSLSWIVCSSSGCCGRAMLSEGAPSAPPELRLLLGQESLVADTKVLGTETRETLVVFRVGQRARIG